MDISQFSQLIGALGFPIACVMGMGWYIVQKDKQHSSDIKDLTKAVAETNKMVQQLTTRIDTLIEVKEGDR